MEPLQRAPAPIEPDDRQSPGLETAAAAGTWPRPHVKMEVWNEKL